MLYGIWYKMLDSCLVYVRSCSMCNRQKKPQKKPNAHQVQYHAGSPLERIHRYHGAIDKTPRGNQYVLVVVDQFSKWVETRRLSRLLEPCYPSSLGDLDALSSCTVIRVATLRVECSRKCVTYWRLLRLRRGPPHTGQARMVRWNV